MLGLWEVVSVVSQFSHVSKVNTLCVTQICKFFPYNTGFFLDTYRAPVAREQAAAPQCRAFQIGPQPRQWQHESRSRWGLDLHFVGQWSPAEAATPCYSEHAALEPPLSSCFLWYQQTTGCGGDLTRISVLHHLSEGSPKPLLGRDAFTPLFLCSGGLESDY